MTTRIHQEPVSKTRATMNALRIHTAEGPAGLVFEQVQTPPLQPSDALVRVHAAAITRDELTWPVERLPAIPSFEFSGVVAAVAPGVSDFSIGDSVYALSDFERDGAAADYIAIQAAFLAHKPRALSHIQSAAIPLAALSAWQGLFVQGGLAAGQRVLIHGAAGGVGSFAVQLAHHYGAEVIGTASTKDHETVRQLGADRVIDPILTPFEDAAGQMDLVFDTTGGERLERSPAVVRPGGKIVSVAVEPPRAAAAERGIEAIYFVVEPNREQLNELARLADAGKLRPVIESVYPLTEARQAFERSLAHHGPGKIVLQVSAE